MSAVPADITYDAAAAERGRESGLPGRASAYFWLVVAAATAATTPYLIKIPSVTTHAWITFAVLGVAVAVAQIFVVVTPANQAYQTTGVFLVAAALLLPPELVAMMAAVQHVPDWLKRRLPFHIQMFNIANHTLAVMGGWFVAETIMHSHIFGLGRGTTAFAGMTACVVYVALNHALLAPMLRFARGHSLRESGLFSYENLSTDLVLGSLGVGVAALWHYDVWLLPFAVAPLLLIHRSLSVPALEAEARVDPKTGLFNARHFAAALREELGRATRFERPMALIMADLDLLRDINNTYGHLAGDAVLAGVAKVFREQLREYDVPARFGGEEFTILLPETRAAEAAEIAERIRRAVASTVFEVSTSSEPIRVTVSLGVATYPRDADDANELVHQADLAVYRAKLQGRNRVVDASNEPLLAQPERRTARIMTLPEEPHQPVRPLAPAAEATPAHERRRHARPHAHAEPRFLLVGRRLAVFVSLVGLAGTGVGIAATLFGQHLDVIALVAILALVAVGQALSIEVERTGSISVSAVGALAGAAIIGPRAALAIAITMSVVEWSAHRSVFHKLLFNVGALTLASLAAAEVFSLHPSGSVSKPAYMAIGLVAGFVYFAVNTGMLAVAIGLEGNDNPWRVWRERFRWLIVHYLVYGFIAAVIYEAYQPIGVWSLLVFALPLFLMRETQEAYVRYTEKSSKKLRQAAETIQSQNVSLEQANRLLKERSTAAMESLSATVDARDAYTAGHSRRVQQIALAIARQLGLSQTELEIVGQAALFHDIGKLAVPDSILLKPGNLTEKEWALMQRHAEEGASIINRLGFLTDAVPAIRHHHERFDGRGYPDNLSAEDIPLGARIIHVADAFDSMLSTRVYRPRRDTADAMREVRDHAGTQFCPRCVVALEQIVARDGVDPMYGDAPPRIVAVAS
jgi:diguanylate cyclase (GGDEF)-like protein/putative nucleotidyltransferase with HDIG domain